MKQKKNYKTDYTQLLEQAKGLIDDVPFWIANLANLSALIYQALEDINWAGFYIVHEEGLVLGPFQGKPACIRIPMGKGVCGTAAQENRTVLVPDVHQFPGHIACDIASRSEIVIPIRLSGQVIAVMDIDSPYPERFDETDQEGLERIAEALEKWCMEYHGSVK